MESGCSASPPFGPLIEKPRNARLAVLGGALLAVACASEEAPEPEPKDPMPVATFRLKRQDAYEIQRRFTGTVRSRRRSRLGFERGGELVRVLVDEGDEVSAGTVVAELDTSSLRVRRTELQAALAEAKAQVELAELTSNRVGSLAQRRYASRQSADEARLGLQSARAAADRLRAALDAVNVEIRRSRLVAPFDGRVVARRVDEGTVVSPGTPVVQFLEPEGPEATIGVPVEVGSTLAVGDQRTLRAGTERVSAKLRSKITDVDARTRTMGLIFELPAGAGLVDGEVVELSVTRPVEDPGFWVPLTAMTEGLRGLWTVYGLTVDDDVRDAVVVREAVELLHADESWAFVRGTLDDGQLVVADGIHRVVPGQTVRPLPPSSLASSRRVVPGSVDAPGEEP